MQQTVAGSCDVSAKEGLQKGTRAMCKVLTLPSEVFVSEQGSQHPAAPITLHVSTVFTPPLHFTAT